MSPGAAVAPAFAAAGGLAPAFGHGGIVTTSFGSNSFQFSGTALAPDGDIVVSGQIQSGQQTPPATGAILAYRPNGNLDPAFGSGGILTLPPASPGSPSQTLGAIQPIDILVSVLTINSTLSGGENLLLRLKSNGQADPTFGSGGQVTRNFRLPQGYLSGTVRLWCGSAAE